MPIIAADILFIFLFIGLLVVLAYLWANSSPRFLRFLSKLRFRDEVVPDSTGKEVSEKEKKEDEL